MLPDLWEKIGILLAERRMVAPRQAYKEIEQKHDTLFVCARAHTDMFRENNAQVAKFAAMLTRER